MVSAAVLSKMLRSRLFSWETGEDNLKEKRLEILWSVWSRLLSAVATGNCNWLQLYSGNCYGKQVSEVLLKETFNLVFTGYFHLGTTQQPLRKRRNSPLREPWKVIARKGEGVGISDNYTWCHQAYCRKGHQHWFRVQTNLL